MTGKKELQQFTREEVARMVGPLTDATIQFLDAANISAGSAAYYDLYKAFQTALKCEYDLARARVEKHHKRIMAGT